MKKILPILIVILAVAAIALGWYRYQRSGVKDNGSQGGPAVNKQSDQVKDETLVDTGYKYSYDNETKANGEQVVKDLAFTSPSGEKLIVPSATAAAISRPIRSILGQPIQGPDLSALVLPVNPLSSEEILLSTFEISGNPAGPICAVDKTKVTNRIFTYNVKTSELKEIFKEQINNDRTTLPHGSMNPDCRELRTVGRQGSQLIVLLDDPENSPGPCTSVWFDYKDKLNYLDLTKSGALQKFTVPQAKLDQEKINQEKCVLELQKQ